MKILFVAPHLEVGDTRATGIELAAALQGLDGYEAALLRRRDSCRAASREETHALPAGPRPLAHDCQGSRLAKAV